VSDDRVYLDHGMTGRNRKRPGLEQALAAVREGDTLVVPKLDRLARSVPDARAIGDSLAARGVRLCLGGTAYDPTIRWASASSTSSRRSPSSKSTCCACARAKEWRSPERTASSTARPRKLSSRQQTPLLRLHPGCWGAHDRRDRRGVLRQPRDRVPGDRTSTRRPRLTPRPCRRARSIGPPLTSSKMSKATLRLESRVDIDP
jgi:hypothetical protein